MQELEGKVAVITGGASGIGLSTARALAAAGAKLALVDIEDTALEGAKQSLADTGAEVIGLRADVSAAGALDQVAEQVESHFGAIHIAFNNAGVMVSGPISALSLEDWEWVLGIDLWGVIHGVRAFLPAIQRAGEGHIVNTASTAGLYAGPMIGPYNVAKFGVVALSETLRRELPEDGPIGVSVLCPGAVNTKITASERNRSEASMAKHGASPEGEAMQRGAAALLSTQGQSPEQIAEVVLDGIRAQRFWLISHPDWLDVLDDRLAGMRDGGELRSGFGG